jgi:hypothetical protein
MGFYGSSGVQEFQEFRSSPVPAPTYSGLNLAEACFCLAILSSSPPRTPELLELLPLRPLRVPKQIDMQAVAVSVTVTFADIDQRQAAFADGPEVGALRH